MLHEIPRRCHAWLDLLDIVDLHFIDDLYEVLRVKLYQRHD